MSKVDVYPEELSRLLSMANDMRRAKNDDLLEELPPSSEGIASNCVIANAFNYGCEVGPRRHGLGTIVFTTHEDAITYCKVIGVDPETSTWQTSFGAWVAYLPTELNELALNFDDGEYRDLIPDPDLGFLNKQEEEND